jgi:hypothetical protein
MNKSIWATLVTLASLTSSVSASLLSTGPSGIDSRSAKMRLPDGVTPLPGAGVNIGQVERFRPGLPVEAGGSDDPSLSNQFVRPADVVIGAGEAIEPDEDILNAHATQVAGVMISNDMNDSSSPANGDDPRGVAPSANLYASAYLTGSKKGIRPINLQLDLFYFVHQNTSRDVTYL